LIERLKHRPEVRELAKRPLHASLIASLNLRGNRLPEDRCQLRLPAPRLPGIPGDALQPPERLEAGLALAAIGDPRPGVGLDELGLPDIAWIEVTTPETFIYQDGERLPLPDFHIARYPITFAQFQAFIDAEDGAVNPQWWTDIGAESQTIREPRWSDPNCPRETVTWYQAIAFCRWLSVQMGYEVRLPTEQEWERAARGINGREYPWGDRYRSGYANIGERTNGPNYLERTSPVGNYPLGLSVDGSDDLAGNVWEWCLNNHDMPGNHEVDTNDDWRMLRGGSWSDGPKPARATFRFKLPRNFCFSDVGFRVRCTTPKRPTGQ
jgi:formylglycine-generating enzyme required for sulfatase activity